MSTRPESNQPPDGLETRLKQEPLSDDAERPDWLVGAADVLEKSEEAPVRPLAPLAPKSAPPAPLSVVKGSKSDRPQSWSGAASSIPKLSLVPSQEAQPSPGDEEEGIERSVDLISPIPGLGDAEAASAPSPPPFRPLDEPWYLVWGEAILTNRRVQGAVLLIAALIAGLIFFPKHRERGASLHSILHEPARFEGQAVVVRGEALESFDVGEGYAFNLRQGRDTVVVFSPRRRPELHQHVEVIGTVSTGYLDGAPRVAIFETK
jgi:hypothetical protein